MTKTTKPSANGSRLTQVGPDHGNGGEADIDLQQPCIVRVTIQGTADLLFHRWDCDAVAEKASAKKGSAAKKTDNIESYIWRDDERRICMPGEYLRGAVIGASKFRQDPRSPRKSAMDLYKAAIVPMTPLAPVLVGGHSVTEWEYEDRRRVQVQRNGVTRVRPAFKSGWSCVIDLMCSLPTYVSRDDLHQVLIDAGRLIGLADFRPTFGRFVVTRYEDTIEDN